ncbi:MAG: MFS transporter [Anderseniella sp.]
MINPMAVRTGAVYGSLLLMVGVMLPFLPVWLVTRGFSIGEVAFAIGAQSVTRVVATPVLTYLADRYRARRRFIIVLSMLAAFFMLAAGLADSRNAIVVMVVLAAMSWSPIMPMLDAVAVEQSDAGFYDYGRVRIAGSITFIAGSLGAGALLLVIDKANLIWVLLITHILMALSAVGLPKLGAAKAGDTSPPTIAAAGTVLMTGSFVLLILAAGLTQASHAVYYSFGSLHWGSLGYTAVTIGGLWSIGVVAEIVLFMYARGSIERMGPVLLLMAGAGFGVLRWAGMAFDPPLAIVLLLQVLHAASYGMTHLGTIYYIRRFMDADFAGTAQGVFVAISGGVLMTGAIALAGWSYGASAALSYLWMAAMCLVALLLGVVLKQRTKGWSAR